MDTHPQQAFLARLEQALADGSFAKLTFSKPRETADDLARVTARAVTLKGGDGVSFVYRHDTRDVTKNATHAQARQWAAELLDGRFDHGHLHTAHEQIQIKIGKKGRAVLIASAASAVAQSCADHDRVKHRYLDPALPFLAALGVTTPQGAIVPAMARKWKQINKFIEVLDQAVASSSLRGAEALSVVDFGSGKGYLTFAMHHHLRHTLGLHAHVTGVELRQDMVDLCQAVVASLGLEGLTFERGDVRTVTPAAADVVIALHACDTATDHAMHLGVRARAQIIMCSPCCHKELRPQLLSPHPLRPLLKHGVHLGQQAEMLTDGLRAMVLDACGYEAKVFEFVALEHTNKNKMILAVKRPTSPPAQAIWRQIDELKDFYGVRRQCLETLLRAAQPSTQAGADSTDAAPGPG